MIFSAKNWKKVDYNWISHIYIYCINLYRKLFKISTLAFIFLTALLARLLNYWLFTDSKKCFVVEKQGGSLVHKCCFEIFFYLFNFYSSLWGTWMQMSSICLFCAYAPRITLISVCRQSITKISERRATSMGSMVYQELTHTHTTATHTFISVAFLLYTDTFSFYYYTQLSFRFVLFISFCSSYK